MKLHNKDTGEDGRLMMCQDGDDFPIYIKIGEIRIYYHSFADMVEAGWECSIEPTEPLIKDKKIRKAVRAWAEANGIERVWHECASCWLRGNGLSIEMENEVDELEQGNYAITELCGEEEE